MNVHEMTGFLLGKCLPGDMKVNETHVEYLVRKLNEGEAAKHEATAANASIENARIASGCPAGVDLSDWVRHLNPVAIDRDFIARINLGLAERVKSIKGAL